MSFVKICKWCGKEFTTKRYPTIFCSQSCYFKHKGAEKNKRKLELLKQYDSSINAVYEDGKLFFIKDCDHCGKTFRANRSTGRFCCRKCHDAAKRKHNQQYHEVLEKEEREHILKGKFLRFKKYCTQCGKEFTAYKQTTMFCSSACAKKYRIRQSFADKATKVTSKSVALDVARIEKKFEAKEIMRIYEVSEYLSLSVKTIYRYIEKGIITPLVLPGILLFKKDDLDELFRDGSRFRTAIEHSKPELPVNDPSPVFIHTDEYITITEASKVYGLPLNVVQNSLRKSNLPFERFRNIRFYKRTDVEAFVKKRKANQHPEISDWYTVDDIILEYSMTRKQIYNFMGSHPNIPRKKQAKITYYSKLHVDSLLKCDTKMDLYYSAMEVVERYGIELRRLYKVAKKFKIASFTRSGRIWYLKSDIDRFFTMQET